MAFKPYGGLNPPLKPDRYYYIPDSQIGAPVNFTFEPIVGPLFSEEPNVMEIEQGPIGDCYLLAALLAIVDDKDRGPQFVNHMMVDLKNGRVLIRLFEKDNLQPVFLELDKTSLRHTPPGLFARSRDRHTAPWVYLIEKAYAAYQLKLGGKCFQPMKWQMINGRREQRKDGEPREALNQIEALTSGSSHDSFSILLGKPAKQIKIERDIVRSFIRNDPDSDDYELPTLLIRDPTPQFESFESLDYGRRQAYLRIFRYAGLGYETEIEANIAIRTAIDDFRSKINRENIANIGSLVADIYNVVRNGEFKLFIKRYFPGLEKHTYATLLRYMNERFPTKRGDSVYMEHQLRTFTDIKNLLQAGNLVCLGTDSFIGSNTQYGHFGREATVKGLAGPHAYQVINAYMRGSYRFFLLRNPWHQYTREYVVEQRQYEIDIDRWEEQDVLRARAVTGRPFEPVNSDARMYGAAKKMSFSELDRLRRGNHGVFELELKDLTKRCRNVYVCDPNPWVW